MSDVAIRPLRVIVADDAEPLRALVAHRLSQDGRFDVVAQAGDGETAVAMAATHRPDVVLLDLSMPGIDGLEALRRLRAAVPDTRVVVLSGFRAGEFAPDALALGASAYIEKGIELDRITEALADVCGLEQAPPAVLSRSQPPVLDRRPLARINGTDAHRSGESGAETKPETPANERPQRLPLISFLVLVVVTVVALTVTQASARQQLLDSHLDAARTVASVVSADVDAVVEHVSVGAPAVLGAQPTSEELAALAVLVGAAGAVHVGADGLATAAASGSTEIIGAPLATQFPHIAAALEGEVMVTDRFAAATTGQQIFSYGIPLEDGGALAVGFGADDPVLGADLLAATPTNTAMAWLLDSNGQVIASTDRSEADEIELTPAPTPEQIASGDAVPGWNLARAPVDGPPWSVVLAASDAALYGDIDGALSALPWVLVALLASAGVVALGMADRSRRTAARLEAVNADLASSNEDLEQFAYVASHDLQEPLRKVASYCQLLERRYGDKLGEDGRQYVHYAVDGATRMQQLIADLLRFSRAGRSDRTTVERVELAVALAHARDSVAGRIEETGAQVSIPDEAPSVMADAAQLHQVLQNLLSNALKFRDPGRTPEVEVTAHGEGAMVHLTVRDNGIGIPPEHHERIFGVFQRLHGREEFEGTGVGLAICRRMVERLGGRIWVSSASGFGATFHILLPATGQQR